MLYLFNRTEEPITLSARLIVTINDMPAHSARLLECVNA
jgi:hypothetical protein